MKIKELFVKSLERPINSVVKVDQLDTNTTWQELDEYVITTELRRHYRTFFDNYLKTLDNGNNSTLNSQIGVWVSGFFGSGKSHFIKMLSYLLENKAALNPEGGASITPFNFFSDKLEDTLFSEEIKRAVDAQADVVLFNIDSKADSQTQEASLLKVFWSVFNEMQGFSKDHFHIAELEHLLTEKNSYGKFKEIFEREHGERWETARVNFYFIREPFVKALSEALQIGAEDAARYYDNAESNVSLKIENFAERIKSYLANQPEKKRLIFVADEIGQFIGSNTHLMLNLQTLVEDLGTRCDGRAWVIVTSQEDVEAVLGKLNRTIKNDASKIRGRFHTQLKLSAINTDEVLQERLLKKTTEAETALRKLYAEKGEVLRHQIVFSGGTSLNTFQTEDEFVKSYPFVPYQFKLVQEIFESIRKYGATGTSLSHGERSMLYAFQKAGQKVSGEEIGRLVPLSEFYPPIEEFLESSVSRIIRNASDDSKLQPFDGRVLEVLFLLRFVETFKTTLENIVSLFIDQVDANRGELRTKIEESLQRLESVSLINRNGDEYFFLTDEERRVSTEISDVPISDAEENQELNELIFRDALSSNAEKYRYPLNKESYDFNLYTDGTPYKNPQSDAQNLYVMTPLNADYKLYNEAKCVAESHSQNNGCIIIKLPEQPDLPHNKQFAAELRVYLKTQKYANTRLGSDTPEDLSKIIRDRQSENYKRKERLVSTIDELLTDADYYALGQHLTDNSSSSAKVKTSEAQNYLVKNIFTKLDLMPIENKDWEREIRFILQADDVSQANLVEIEDRYKQATLEIEQYLKLETEKHRRIELAVLTKHFSIRPFGWNEYQTVWLIAKLLVDNKINLKTDDILTREKAVEPLTKRRHWKDVIVSQKQTTDRDTLKAARELGHQLFAKYADEKEEELVSFWKKHLEDLTKKSNGFLKLAETGRYVGKDELNKIVKKLEFQTNIPDNFEFLKQLKNDSDDWRDLKEDFDELDNFYESQRPVWEKLTDALSGSFESNRGHLEKNDEVKNALARLDEIRNMPRPFGVLHETPNLLSIVEQHNEQLLSDERGKTVGQIEAAFESVKTKLDALEADAELRNKTLRPFQIFKERAENSGSLDNLFYIINRDLPDKLQETEDFVEEEKYKKLPDDAPPPKPVFNIKPSQMVDGSYIETEVQADEFVEKIRESIKKGLSEEKRIRII